MNTILRLVTHLRESELREILADPVRTKKLSDAGWDVESFRKLLNVSAPEPPPERKHLVQSAGHWHKSAHMSYRSKAGAVFAMENAYNHVENALAAAVRHIHNLRRNGGTLPDIVAADKFLEDFKDFKL